eukprot:101676_1
MTFQMSIMLHNFEDFNVNYTDFTASNSLVVTQNMDHMNTSYKIVDLVSLFYGISNSIISILDSISDFVFVAFVWEAATQNNNNGVFFVLTIANLIYVAMFISTYVIYRSRIQSLLNRFLGFFVFLILSSILPSLEWMLKRFEFENNRMLIVSPNHDGALLWFQQEFIRNQIFIIECMIESCFQLMIQFSAVFEFEDVGKNAYLFISMLISSAVVLSKFILLSYNMRKQMIFLNMLCYFMDILFSLIFAIFISSFILQNIFSATALYLILEIMIFIPFYCYYISYLLSKTYLTVLILIFFIYPILLLSLCSFSIFPLLTYLFTNPTEIGQKEQLHKELFEYCVQSKNKREYEIKVIISNYVCAQTYFANLNRSEEKHQFYEFIDWLCQQNKLSLKNIRFQEFQHRANNTFYQKILTSFLAIDDLSPFANIATELTNIKVIQIFIRVLMLTLALLLDIFYFKIFHTNSKWLQIYGNIMGIFGPFILIFLVCWLFSILYEGFISKWNSFCFNIITSKHPQFVLSVPTEALIQQCKEIYTMNEVQDNSSSESQILQTIIDIDSIYDVDIEISQSLFWCSVLLQSIIVPMLVYVNTQEYACFQYTGIIILTINLMLMCIVLSIYITLLLYFATYSADNCKYTIGIIIGICFASYLASISLHLLFIHHTDCHSNFLKTVVVLQVAGSLLCVFNNKLIHMLTVLVAINVCMYMIGLPAVWMIIFTVINVSTLGLYG